MPIHRELPLKLKVEECFKEVAKPGKEAVLKWRGADQFRNSKAVLSPSPKPSLRAESLTNFFFYFHKILHCLVLTQRAEALKSC